MIWLFWGLLGTIVGGMLLLAVLARRGRPRLRPAQPNGRQRLRAVGHSLAGLLWTLSHPAGMYSRSRHHFDYSRDYVEEHERQTAERRRRSRES